MFLENKISNIKYVKIDLKIYFFNLYLLINTFIILKNQFINSKT